MEASGSPARAGSSFARRVNEQFVTAALQCGVAGTFAVRARIAMDAGDTSALSMNVTLVVLMGTLGVMSMMRAVSALTTMSGVPLGGWYARPRVTFIFAGCLFVSSGSSLMRAIVAFRAGDAAAAMGQAALCAGLLAVGVCFVRSGVDNIRGAAEPSPPA